MVTSCRPMKRLVMTIVRCDMNDVGRFTVKGLKFLYREIFWCAETIFVVSEHERDGAYYVRYESCCR